MAFNFGGSPGDYDATCAVWEIEFHHFGFPLNAYFVRVPRVSIVARARAFVRLAVALYFQFLSFRFTCRTRHSRNIGTRPRVAALLNWQSEVSADRGGGVYRTASTIAGFPQLRRVVFHRSALTESAIQSMGHAINGCPVESCLSLAHVRKAKVRVVLGGDRTTLSSRVLRN